MKESFGATSTTDEVLVGLDLRGKRVLVTGVSAGLGDALTTAGDSSGVGAIQPVTSIFLRQQRATIGLDERDEIASRDDIAITEQYGI